jgi:PAS domain S-box-containing protein
MFGHPAAHAIGAYSVDLLVPEAARTAHRERVEKVLAAVTPEQPGERLEIVACRADGSEFPGELFFSQIATRGPVLYTAFVRDLTAEKRASAELERQKDEAEAAARQLASSEERLRALAARLDAVREDESRRIARDVHDVLGQALTALKLDLAWLECRLTREPLLEDGREIATERCRAMIELVDGTLDAVKRIAADLRPGVLDELGIEAALEWQTSEFSRRSGIAIDLDVPADPIVLGAAEATALFRITQEALTNIARHAQATRVSVRLAAEGGEALLVISDDGIGLRDDRSTSRDALGLVGMRERAALLGGSVAVSGAPGKGTTVVARLPLRAVPASKRAELP